jgi:general secretion pathway protein D
VGLTLKITPNISKDRQVRLNISQELTALSTTPEETDFRPSTLKRSIDTTVVVKDKSTVVIGGLIGETINRTVSQVPCLGSVPGLKWLFRSQTRQDEKTNLYIFLKPTVVVGQTEATELFEQKKNYMKRIKEGKIKMYEKDIF